MLVNKKETLFRSQAAECGRLLLVVAAAYAAKQSAEPPKTPAVGDAVQGT
jgi:hypothetical protein